MLYWQEGLNFAERGDNGSLWGPLLEKGFAKIKGSYSIANGGFSVNGIRSLTGIPVFNYYMEDETDYTTTFATLKAANDLDYILTTGTYGSDTSTNACGIVAGHAYSLISVFELTDTSGNVEHNMYMLRNPWGITYYAGTWNYEDTDSWTSDYIS